MFKDFSHSWGIGNVSANTQNIGSPGHVCLSTEHTSSLERWKAPSPCVLSSGKWQRAHSPTARHMDENGSYKTLYLL